MITHYFKKVSKEPCEEPANNSEGDSENENEVNTETESENEVDIDTESEEDLEEIAEQGTSTPRPKKQRKDGTKHVVG